LYNIGANKDYVVKELDEDTCGCKKISASVSVKKPPPSSLLIIKKHNETKHKIS
jgi:hypothetical protein